LSSDFEPGDRLFKPETHVATDEDVRLFVSVICAAADNLTYCDADAYFQKTATTISANFGTKADNYHFF
jgi:hypothetical protein